MGLALMYSLERWKGDLTPPELDTQKRTPFPFELGCTVDPLIFLLFVLFFPV